VVVVEVEAWMMGTLTGAHYGKDLEENGAGSTQEKMVVQVTGNEQFISYQETENFQKKG